MMKSRKNIYKRLIMFVMALVLMLSAPATCAQAASSTDKKLKKQVDSIVKKKVKTKDSKKEIRKAVQIYREDI